MHHIFKSVRHRMWFGKGLLVGASHPGYNLQAHGLAVQLYSVAVSLPVKHQQPGDKLGRFWRNTPNDVTSSNVGALIFEGENTCIKGVWLTKGKSFHFTLGNFLICFILLLNINPTKNQQAAKLAICTPTIQDRQKIIWRFNTLKFRYDKTTNY